MPKLTIVYWRDIPAQVIVRQGRQSAKRELPLRFTEAIDMCAMRSGVAETDAYLQEWRRGEPVACGGDMEAEAQAMLEKLDNDYNRERLKSLIATDGKEAGK